MTGIDRAAGFQLLETGTAMEFNVTNTTVHEGPDAAEFSVEIDLEFPPDAETEETDLNWGAFGFLFVIGSLSFADARPRESSVIDYVENDEFQVGDLIGCLRWEDGTLNFDSDYLRGRRMKTRVVLRPDGSGRLTTTGRGKSPVMWLERLKGKNPLSVVQP